MALAVDRIVSRRGTLALGLALAAAACVALAVAARTPHRPPPPPLRLATFNIEEFPKDARQIDGALALIATLDADAVALEEIVDPAALLAAAHRYLGPRWEFAYTDVMPVRAPYPPMHEGVLYDGARYTLVSTATHDDTRLDGGRHKPVLEVRLAPRNGGANLQIFVVHLKSGSDGRGVRARQYAALSRLIQRVRRPDERTMLAGDFNATEQADRDDLRALAGATGLTWASEDLPCSAFWRRADDCPTSRLDHVLTWAAPSAIEARGACAEGCQLRDRCPLYREEISDHCPVVATWP